jgi:hypothetical protein
MIAKNWDWVNDEVLMNDIINLDNKLSNYGLMLDWYTSEVSESIVALQVVSEIDSTITIKDLGFIHTHLLLWSDKLKTRLQIIAKRVEFIAFVHDSILNLKNSDERLLFYGLRFVCHYDCDDAVVDFNFSKCFSIEGSGHFKHNQDIDGVSVVVGSRGIAIECPSLLNISNLPHDLSLDISVYNNGGYITSTVSGTLRKTYGSLSVSEKLALVEDLSEAISYFDNLRY